MNEEILRETLINQFQGIGKSLEVLKKMLEIKIAEMEVKEVEQKDETVTEEKISE